MLLGHAFHRVDVAESSCVANVAVKAAAIYFCEEVFGFLVNHGDGEFLVEGGVAESFTLATSRILRVG
jgi:hypothetical protein